MLCIPLVSAALFGAARPPSITESAKEPVRCVGAEQPDRRFYDGALRHAVGVHHFQALRANRSHPPEGGKKGWTYNHQPYLAYWNGRFFLQYLSNPIEEHVPPGRTLVMTSMDGRNWSAPRIVFPETRLPENQQGGVFIPESRYSVMHQRMGFYIAPNGRFLTSGFYGITDTPRTAPNNGRGLGRVVREIRRDGSFGPIAFIRYNRHAGYDESNTSYPFYRTNPDKGFVEACDSLLNDKLMTLAWWEEDRAEDGFYTIPLDGKEPKAPCFCRRPDGTVLAVWKGQWSALSPDNGNTWTPLVRSKTLMDCNAKVWIQPTGDGRYALVYNPSATRRNRFPLAVMTSDDCRDFSGLLCLDGEVPPMRYQGQNKNLGPQYVRGIEEGNGEPPGDFLWIAYSRNKEDIWVSRIRIPVAGSVAEHADENFDDIRDASELDFWNLHVPEWAAVSIKDDGSEKGSRYLELRDADPYDYALAERAFPESRNVEISFRVRLQRPGTAVLDVEVQDGRGKRPMRLRLDSNWLMMDAGKVEPEPIAVAPKTWISLRLSMDCRAQKYDLCVDGEWVRKEIAFADSAATLERIIFRTGPYRMDVRSLILDGEPGMPGTYQEDLPGADRPADPSVYWIDDFKTR